MRLFIPAALLLGSTALSAQGIYDSSVRLAPQFYAYDIKAPLNEKITQFSVPFFVTMPLTQALTVDVGTAFATVTLERTTSTGTTETSEMSGLTDTQVRANYAIGADFIVLTLGINAPTGSATVDLEKLDAATRIGSDFLMFPISGFGSGLGFTGGVAVAKPAGAWNLGFGASVRQSTEYEPFRDPTTGEATKFQPGPEYRARFGVDRPFGTGQISMGLMYSMFGDDKSNAVTFSSGDRYVGQFALNNSFAGGTQYSLVVWHLYRTAGTLINQSASTKGNISNATLAFGLRGPGDMVIEPSLESRMWTQPGTSSSNLNTLGLRFVWNRGMWAAFPGLGYSIGSMEGASLNGYRASLGFRFGGG